MSPPVTAAPSTGTAADPPRATEVRRWLRRTRARSRPAGWSWDGVYTVALAVGFVVAAFVAAAYALADGHAVDPGLPSALVLAATLGGVAMILSAAAALGPLSAPPAALAWLATSPVSRRGLLLPRFAMVVAAGAVAGTVPAVLVLPYFPSPGAPVLVGLGVALGVTSVAGATLTQIVSRRPERPLRVLATVAGLSAVAAAAADGSGLWSGPPVREAPPGGVLWVVGVVAGVATVVAAARLDAVRIPVLRSAASAAAAFTGGIGVADPGLLSRVTEDRRWRRRRLRPRTPLPAGAPAIVVHDLLSLLRQPGRTVVWAALAAVPWLLAASSGSDTVPVVGWLLAGLLATGQFTGSIRYDVDRPTIARLLGLTDRRLLVLRSVVPTVVAGLWGAGSVALVLVSATGDPVGAALLGIAAGPALAVGAIRSARRSFVRHDYPLIVTPMGVVPSGPLVWAGQAVDLALIGTVPTLVALAGRQVDLRVILVQAGFSVLVLGVFLRSAGGRRRNSRILQRGWAMITRAVTLVWRL